MNKRGSAHISGIADVAAGSASKRVNVGGCPAAPSVSTQITRSGGAV
jgi:hypothetical protein